jgi:glycosyltransferase involved in cell wall biosynthesis
MRVLFIHHQCPGQYPHLARHLAARGHTVRFLTQSIGAKIPGVTITVYSVESPSPSQSHPYTPEIDRLLRVGTAAAEAGERLRAEGFVPDLIVGHNGFGELLFLRDVWPGVPVLGNCEFYYRASGADVGFDPEFDSIFNSPAALRVRNLPALFAADTLDWAHVATRWQKSLHPGSLQARMTVVHEGIDTRLHRPDDSATFRLPNGRVLDAKDTVVTYVARNLEPYRGFHTFMRSLPAVLRRCPDAEVVIVGGDGVSYGAPPAPGRSFREELVAQLGKRLDGTRVHFTGQIPNAAYRRLLNVSSAHVYLTVPFVLGWSCLEAMASGCLLIGSRTPPVEEVIEDGVNGLLVDMLAPDDIAEQIVGALRRRKSLAPLRAAARATVLNRYDLKTRALPRWDTLLEDLVAGRTPSPD